MKFGYDNQTVDLFHTLVKLNENEYYSFTEERKN